MKTPLFKNIFSKFCVLITLIYRSIWVRRIFKCALAGILIFLVLLGWANWKVHDCDEQMYGDVDKIPARDTGLLLGTRRTLGNGRWINAYYWHRIEAAVVLYKAHKIKKIIISGDNGRHTYNEPVDMQNDLIRLGVDTDAIVLDYAGFRTLDSILRARSVFHTEAFTVISQDFHCRRALFIAKAHGFDAIGFAAEDVNRRGKLRRIFREPLACLLAYMDVYFLNTKPHFQK